MTTYCVAYDLNNSGKNYDGLIQAIENYTNIKALYSTWFIKSNSSASDIYNNLSSYIDRDDHLFVVEISSSNQQGWMPKKVWDWLKN